MYFDDINIIDFMLGNQNMTKQNNNLLVDNKTGLLRGNMFTDEYVPYKNFKEKEIMPKSEREELLLKIYETDFAIKDINLFLDLNPKDTYMYETLKQYVNKYNNYKTMYENKYGPLCITSTNSNTYKWIDNPWPWDNTGGTLNV